MAAVDVVLAELGREVARLREEVVGAIHALGAEHHDLLRPEDVARRLSCPGRKITRGMKSGALPRGVLWFENPVLGPFFSWRRLKEWIMSDPGWRTGQDDCEDAPVSWRRSA
jgi:hypothetical protein